MKAGSKVIRFPVSEEDAKRIAEFWQEAQASPEAKEKLSQAIKKVWLVVPARPLFAKVVQEVERHFPPIMEHFKSLVGVTKRQLEDLAAEKQCNEILAGTLARERKINGVRRKDRAAVKLVGAVWAKIFRSCEQGTYEDLWRVWPNADGRDIVEEGAETIKSKAIIEARLYSQNGNNPLDIRPADVEDDEDLNEILRERAKNVITERERKKALSRQQLMQEAAIRSCRERDDEAAVARIKASGEWREQQNGIRELSFRRRKSASLFDQRIAWWAEGIKQKRCDTQDARIGEGSHPREACGNCNGMKYHHSWGVHPGCPAWKSSGLLVEMDDEVHPACLQSLAGIPQKVWSGWLQGHPGPSSRQNQDNIEKQRIRLPVSEWFKGCRLEGTQQIPTGMPYKDTTISPLRCACDRWTAAEVRAKAINNDLEIIRPITGRGRWPFSLSQVRPSEETLKSFGLSQIFVKKTGQVVKGIFSATPCEERRIPIGFSALPARPLCASVLAPPQHPSAPPRFSQPPMLQTLGGGQH